MSHASAAVLQQETVDRLKGPVSIHPEGNFLGIDCHDFRLKKRRHNDLCWNESLSTPRLACPIAPKNVPVLVNSWWEANFTKLWWMNLRLFFFQN